MQLDVDVQLDYIEQEKKIGPTRTYFFSVLKHVLMKVQDGTLPQTSNICDDLIV